MCILQWNRVLPYIYLINSIMYKNQFGTQNQIVCATPHEYYELLGYLAKSDGTTSLVWEHNENQGAWGSEGRIHGYVDEIPLTCAMTLTQGVGSICHRVNCNEFIEHIVVHHRFVQGKVQNIAQIRSTIPLTYLNDFDRGLAL